MPGPRMTACQLLLTLEPGGAEILAGRLARRLSGEFRVIFACLDRSGALGDELAADGFEVHVLGRRSGIDWGCMRRLAGLIRRERVDLVHAHQYGPFFYAAGARFHGAGAPIVLTEHGRNFPDLVGRSHRIANRLFLRRRDRLAGVGRDVRRALIEKEGFPAGRVEVIYNGIDLSSPATAGDDREATRRELGIGTGEFLIVQAARLVPIKDHATAIRALGRLLRDAPGARLLIAGDGPEAGAIGGLIRERGLEGRARLLGHRADVRRLLGAADAALLTSLSEGIPLSLIEAMAAGLPVVATRVGGVPEVVEEGETGLLAPAGDDAGLAGHLLRLAGDPALAARLGSAGRLRAALFSEDRMVAEYDRLYREVLAGAGGARRPRASGGGGA